MLKKILPLFLFVFCLSSLSAQDQFSLSSPRAAVKSHLLFLQDENMDPAKAARALYNEGDDLNAEELESLAIKLKQIYDGSGNYIELADIPNSTAYVDSASKKARFVISKKFPELYVQRYQEKWQYSAKSVAAIPRIHAEVFPAGANLFVKLTTIVGNWSFLRLRSWQWAGALLMLLVISFSFQAARA
jgi:MscS family membrane protein